MTYIQRDGKFYEQIISEREIILSEEKYKLQCYKDALVNDEREMSEYKTKLAEIDGLELKEEYKKKLKDSVVMYSPSGITKEDVAEAEKIVAEVEKLLAESKTTK